MDREKIIYIILNKLQDGQEPKQTDYELDLQKWGEIAELIRDEGYAKNIRIQRGGIGNKVIYAWYDSAKITMDGINFLKLYSEFEKTE